MGYNVPLIETSCRFNCEILLYGVHMSVILMFSQQILNYYIEIFL